jgi:hypothetical protein
VSSSLTPSTTLIGVSMKPGAMAFTRMPAGASSSASARQYWLSAAFAML